MNDLDEVITPKQATIFNFPGQSKIHNLFPTPVGIYEIEHKLNKKELSFIKNQDQRNNLGNTTSQDNKILFNKELSGLRKALENKLNVFFHEIYNPRREVSLRITQSWINYTNKGQYHHKHKHPNSFVSGIFYIETTSEDKVYFYNNSNLTNIKMTPINWNTWNSESWWFEATQNNLILFPSTLEHMVETVKSEETRISLSFNTFLVGKLGEEQDLTALELL